MSVHAHTSRKVSRRLVAQKRRSVLWSLVGALLGVLFLGTVLYCIGIAVTRKPSSQLLAYAIPVDEVVDESIVQPSNEVVRKPSVPADGSASSVIAAKASQSVAVPQLDFEATEVSVELGDSEDFGDGWNSEAKAGGASFFKQKSKAKRFCYVVDYSLSMHGKRIDLLKKELSRSIQKLPDTVDYQVIFFAGPAWFAGDEVMVAKDKTSAIVTSGNRITRWSGSGPSDWSVIDSAQPTASWLRANAQNVGSSLQVIEETDLVFGTSWAAPLSMALNLQPQPEVIFFMTDGLSGDDSAAIVNRVGQKAAKGGVQINTVAMMVPSASEEMKTLATMTGGQFSIVEKSGKVKVVVKAKQGR